MVTFLRSFQKKCGFIAPSRVFIERFRPKKIVSSNDQRFLTSSFELRISFIGKQRKRERKNNGKPPEIDEESFYKTKNNNGGYIFARSCVLYL